jgi:hypothetical protein
MQKSYQANAPRHDNQNEKQTDRKKGQQLTGVLQKWGICTKFEHWNSKQHL